jgi:hypothetical protein
MRLQATPCSSPRVAWTAPWSDVCAAFPPLPSLACPSFPSLAPSAAAHSEQIWIRNPTSQRRIRSHLPRSLRPRHELVSRLGACHGVPRSVLGHSSCQGLIAGALEMIVVRCCLSGVAYCCTGPSVTLAVAHLGRKAQPCCVAICWLVGCEVPLSMRWSSSACFWCSGLQCL